MFPEIGCQRGQKFRMRRWIGGAEVIHRIDNTPPEELAPDTVHSGFGEVGMRGHPARKLPPRIRIRLCMETRSVEQGRHDRRFRAGMYELNLTAHVLRAQI